MGVVEGVVTRIILGVQALRDKETVEVAGIKIGGALVGGVEGRVLLEGVQTFLESILTLIVLEVLEVRGRHTISREVV